MGKGDEKIHMPSTVSSPMFHLCIVAEKPPSLSDVESQVDVAGRGDVAKDLPRRSGRLGSLYESSDCALLDDPASERHRQHLSQTTTA